MNDVDEPLTLLLQRATDGDAGAGERFFAAVHGELRRMAAAAMRQEAAGHLLQPTALVNEVFLRIWPSGCSWESRRHFFGAAARSMRQVLVDHARRRAADKRGGGALQVSFAAAAEAEADHAIDLVRLDELLRELERANPRHARLVELRHFAGLGIDEAADALGVSPATVKRDWAFVRAWLLDRLGGPGASP